MDNKLLCEPIECELVGIDGNAFNLLGHWSKKAREQGRTPEEIKSVRDAAMSGDYNNLVATLFKHCK